jgi:hypothetical protein
VHLSTDAGRAETRRAVTVASRFPGYRVLRDGLLRRLQVTGRGTGVVFDRDVRPWIGKEAALALVRAGAAASSLLVFDVANRAEAQNFIGRLGTPGPVVSYHGVKITRYGSQAIAFVSHYLLAGSLPVLTQGIDAQAGRAPALAADPSFRRAARNEPDGRFADLYASRAGVRQVLQPRRGALGSLGALVDQPALAGITVSLSARRDGLRVKMHSVLDPARAALTPAAFTPFSPALPAQAPGAAIAFVDLNGLDRALPRLLGASAAGGLAGRVGQLVAKAGQGLTATGVDVPRDVAPLFRGETALLITPHEPVPTLTLIARTADEARARVAFAQLQAPIARLFAPPGAGPGQAPVFTEESVAGVQAFRLRLSPTLELDYAVFGGRLVASTSLAGIAAARATPGRIGDLATFRAALAGRPGRVTALVFLDLNQLLSLAEQIGLDQDPRYLRVRDDLKRIHAVGFTSASGEADTTAELFLQIP